MLAAPVAESYTGPPTKNRQTMISRSLPARRTVLLLAALVLAAPVLGVRPASAQTMANCDESDPGQVRLKVEVRGMRNANGNVTMTIYPDNAEHFLDSDWKVARQIMPVSLPATRACFALPAPGYYAVAMFHDENNNRHFDTTMLGLPAEGWGFSRDPKLYIGPPKLDQVRIAVHPGDNIVLVRMKYW